MSTDFDAQNTIRRLESKLKLPEKFKWLLCWAPTWRSGPMCSRQSSCAAGQVTSVDPRAEQEASYMKYREGASPVILLRKAGKGAKRAETRPKMPVRGAAAAAPPLAADEPCCLRLLAGLVHALPRIHRLAGSAEPPPLALLPALPVCRHVAAGVHHCLERRLERLPPASEGEWQTNAAGTDRPQRVSGEECKQA